MNSRTRFSLLLIVLGMNVLFIIAPAAPATALMADIYLDDTSCEIYLGGIWNGSDCYTSSVTILFGDRLIIGSGQLLYIGVGVTLTNEGKQELAELCDDMHGLWRGTRRREELVQTLTGICQAANWQTCPGCC